MPQYDFECESCHARFEVRASLSEYVAMQKDKSIRCPACGARKPVRVFTAPGVLAGASWRRPTGGCCPGGRCG